MASMLTLTYLSIVVTLRLPIVKHASVFPEQQKHTMLLQTYILTWILLLFSTIAIGESHIGGFYFTTVWNTLAFLGCALGCAEGMLGAKGMQDQAGGERHRFVRGVRFETVGEDEEGTNGERSAARESGEVETEPTEITPLMHQHRRSSHSRSPGGRRQEEGGAIGWWILQLLIVIPFPVILASHMGTLLMASLSQTLADGSSAVIGESKTSALTRYYPNAPQPCRSVRCSLFDCVPRCPTTRPFQL
jgi:hypothetical protein